MSFLFHTSGSVGARGSNPSGYPARFRVPPDRGGSARGLIEGRMPNGTMTDGLGFSRRSSAIFPWKGLGSGKLSGVTRGGAPQG